MLQRLIQCFRNHLAIHCYAAHRSEGEAHDATQQCRGAKYPVLRSGLAASDNAHASTFYRTFGGLLFPERRWNEATVRAEIE